MRAALALVACLAVLGSASAFCSNHLSCNTCNGDSTVSVERTMSGIAGRAGGACAPRCRACQATIQALGAARGEWPPGGTTLALVLQTLRRT